MSCNYSGTTPSYQLACLNPRLNSRTRDFWRTARTCFFPASPSLQLGNPSLGSPLFLIDLHPRSLWLRPCIPDGHSVVRRVIYPPIPKWALYPSVRWCVPNWEIQFFTQTLKFHKGWSSVKSHVTLIILNKMSLPTGGQRKSFKLIVCKGSYQLGFNVFGPSWTLKKGLKLLSSWPSCGLTPASTVLMFKCVTALTISFSKSSQKGLYTLIAVSETVN